jgi:penicillin-binding protein 2
VPGFDPNSFVAGLTSDQYHALTDNPHQPLFDRAAEGAYPLGSIFKIVAMGAALEKGGMTVDTQIPGPGVWYGLGPGYPMHDWLATGHGIISLHEALVQSCDTCFYQVGLQLDQKNHYLLPDYARAWGFGAPTGIVGVPENAGIIPDPHWTLTQRGEPWVPGDAVNMTIGQGYVEVTPLQVAQMLAALGDNGVMHQPYVVSRITAANGAVVRAYPPVVKGTLPLSQSHLQDILKAMLGVTTEPTGTAADKFAGFRWPVGGKTGTAQAGALGPHAWFAALAPLGHPRIALIVMVEHGGEGSQAAAPIARQILQTFFTQVPDLAGTGSSKGPTTLAVP